MPENHFWISQDFYQKDMAGDNVNKTDHDIKLGIPVRWTSRGRGIIEAGEPFWLKIALGHWEKSAKMVPRTLSFSFLHQSHSFQNIYKWTFSAWYWSHFMDSCCPWDDEYSQITNLQVWPFFQWKWSVRNSFRMFSQKFYQIYWTPC